MGKLFSALLGGWKSYVAVAVLVAALTDEATYYVTSLGYRVTISNMERDGAKSDAANANASLAQFEADTVSIHGAALALATAQGQITSQFKSLSKDFSDVVKNNPLPADCQPDAFRMRALSAAVAAANAAAGRIAVPAVPDNK